MYIKIGGGGGIKTRWITIRFKVLFMVLFNTYIGWLDNDLTNTSEGVERARGLHSFITLTWCSGGRFYPPLSDTLSSNILTIVSAQMMSVNDKPIVIL